MKEKSIRKKIIKIIKSKYFAFLLAFLLMFFTVKNINLLSDSGDASETWKVIKTFFSKNHYYSYVMYKGIYAFIPGVISLYISKIIHVSEFCILNILNSFIFAYITVYGLPYLINYLFKNKKQSIIQVYLLIIFYYFLERSVYYFLSVDTISCALFIIMTNSCIRNINNNFNKFLKLFYLGLLIGINLCLSGQFTISTYIILIYLIIVIIKNFKENIKKIIQILLILFLGLFITKGINEFYMRSIVYPAKDSGVWLPSGQEWIKAGYSSNILTINYPKSVPDYLSMNIVKSEDEKLLNKIIEGQFVFDTPEYIKMIIKNPVRFIVRWSERLFLGMVNDPINVYGKLFYNNTIILEIMLMLIYSFWNIFKKTFKKFSDLLSFKFFILVAVIFSALVPSFGHVENRYYLLSRTVIIGSFFLSPTLNVIFKNLKSKKIISNSINYNIINCLIFMLLGTIIYYAIYQSIGV